MYDFSVKPERQKINDENGKPILKTSQCPLCNKDCFGTKYCSETCAGFSKRKVTRPSKEELEKLINSSMPMTKIGGKYGVSDAAIKKWMRCYSIPKRKTFRHQITNCKQCGKEIKAGIFCSHECASENTRRQSPAFEELEKLIREGRSAGFIASIYKANHNTVRKWLDKYNLPYGKKKEQCLNSAHELSDSIIMQKEIILKPTQDVKPMFIQKPIVWGYD
jgi:transposase-like protein